MLITLNTIIIKTMDPTQSIQIIYNSSYLHRPCLTPAYLKRLRSHLKYYICELYLKLTSMVVETMLQLLPTR